MSHWSTDAAVDNIQTDISSMSDVDVMNNLISDIKILKKEEFK